MEIKDIPVPNMSDWLKLYNTYDPEHYTPGKRVSAEEWNSLFLASVRQGNYNADTLELLIKTYLPDTYLTIADFNVFADNMQKEYIDFTNLTQQQYADFTSLTQQQYTDFVKDSQTRYNTFTTQVQDSFNDVVDEVNELESRVVSAEAVAYSLNDTIQEANRYAKQAFNTSEEAKSTAQTATNTANSAVDIADSAVAVSEDAFTNSQTALTNSQNAVNTANTASTNSTQAINTANAASLRADDAISTANAAKVESASAKTIASQADTTANNANTTSQTANNTAAEARRIAQAALDQITEGVGTQVLVNGESVAVFNADIKADLDYVDRQVAALIGAAPETLDTLEEVAAAFEENKEVVDALNAAIGTKANKADIEPTIQFAEAERQKSKNLFNPDDVVIENGLSYGYVPIKCDGPRYSISFHNIKRVPQASFGLCKNPKNANEGYVWMTRKSTGIEHEILDNVSIANYPYIFIYPNTLEAFNEVLDALDVQIEEGSVVTSYQPYNGPITHNNDAPVVFAEVERQKSKNLFDLSRVSMTQYSDAIPEIDIKNETMTVKRYYNASLNTLKDFTDLKVGKTYTLSLSASDSQYIHLVGSASTWGHGTSHTITQAELDGTVAFYGLNDGGAQTISNIQIEEGTAVTEYHSYNGAIAHKKDLANKVSFQEYTGISVAGNTKTVYKYDPTTIYAPNGLIMGGTALQAGLVTRGICGVDTPNESGYCPKDHLFINYDGSNDYSSTRQLILQASSSGTHYGNNLYQYAAARGDAVKNYCDANYLSLNNGGKLKGKLSFDGDNSITPLQAISYIVGLQPFASGGNLVYMNADKFKKQVTDSIVSGGLNYFTTGYIKSAAPASGITTNISSNILTVVAAEGNGNYISISIDNDIEANMAEGEEFIFSMDIRATTDTGTAVSGKPRIYFKEGMGYYDMSGEVKRLSSGVYTTLTYVGNWKKTNNIALHLGFGSAVGKFYITNLRFEKGNTRTELARLLKVDSTNITTNKSLAINHATEPKVLLTAASAGNDIRVEFKCESSGTNSFIGIGSGGVNNGYYSRTLDKWLWYADASKWYLNQPTLSSPVLNAPSVPSGQTLTVAGNLTVSGTSGFNYTGIETATANAARTVWFSYDTKPGTPCRNTDFTYNPGTKVMKVNGTVECSTINLLV